MADDEVKFYEHGTRVRRLLEPPSPVVPTPTASETATAQVEARFLLPSGAPVVRSYSVPPATRLNILVDGTPGLDATDVSGVVASIKGVPMIVERAMWWPSPGDAWHEAHNSFGATQAVTTWGFADG